MRAPFSGVLIPIPIPTKKLLARRSFFYWCRLGDCAALRLLPASAIGFCRPAYFRPPAPPCRAPFSDVLIPIPIPTKKLLARRSFFYWCRLGDSNARPTHYECVALPTELNRHSRNIHKTLYFILQVLFFAYSYFIRPAVPSVLRPPCVPPLAGTESRYLLQ